MTAEEKPAATPPAKKSETKPKAPKPTGKIAKAPKPQRKKTAAPQRKPKTEAPPPKRDAKPAVRAHVRFYVPKRNNADGSVVWLWLKTPLSVIPLFKDRKETGSMSAAVREAWKERPAKFRGEMPAGETVDRAIVFPTAERPKIEKWEADGNDLDAYIVSRLEAAAK